MFIFQKVHIMLYCILYIIVLHKNSINHLSKVDLRHSAPTPGENGKAVDFRSSLSKCGLNMA